MADRQAKAATIARPLVVISQAHKTADLPSRTTLRVNRTQTGVRRTLGKTRALVDELKRMLDKLPPTPVGLRDRALLLLGSARAFRRSELVSLDVADLEFTRAGLLIMLRKAKTDQEGNSWRLVIPYGSSEQARPVRSLQASLERWCKGLLLTPIDWQASRVASDAPSQFGCGLAGWTSPAFHVERILLG